jgi:hypothetical protein
LEQVVFYFAILAALAGFAMGVMNIVGPYLRSRNITLSSLPIPALLRRGEATDDEDGFDIDDDGLEADREAAERSFAAGGLLMRRRTAIDDEELDDELTGVLDGVAEEDIDADEDDDTEEGEAEEPALEDEDDGPYVYTVSAEVDEGDEDEADESIGDLVAEVEEEVSDEEDAEDEDEGEDEEEGEGDEEEEAQPEVQVVGAGGETSDDMMSFFDEAADAGAGAIAPWREDLQEVGIDELLAEARAIREQIHGKKSNAA